MNGALGASARGVHRSARVASAAPDPLAAAKAPLDGRVVLPLVATWVALSCFPGLALPDIEGMPYLSADRIAMVLLVGYAAAWMALRRARLGRFSITECGLWCLVLIATVSGIVFGAFGSGYQGARVSILLNFLLYPAVLYSVLWRTRYDARDLASAAGILTLLAAYLGVTAVLERTSFTWLLVPPSIGDPTITQHWGRSRGPFLQAEFNGAVMVQLLPIVIYQLKSARWGARLLALFTIPVLGVGVYLTETRAAILSLAVLVLAGAMIQHAARRIYLWLGVALALGSAVLFGSGVPLVPRMEEVNPLLDRINLLLVTLGMFVMHPIVGIGFGNFDLYQIEFFRRPTVLGEYAAAVPGGFWAGGTHNTLVTPLAEMGLLAGGLFIALAVGGTIAALVNGYRAGRGEKPGAPVGVSVCAGLAGLAFLVNAVFVELRFTATPNAIFWVLLALAQSSSPRKASWFSRPGRERVLVS